jgi:hypothetical protein
MVKHCFCTNWIWESMLNPGEKTFEEWLRYKRIVKCRSGEKFSLFFLCKDECIAHELCIYWNKGALVDESYSIVKVPLEKNSLRPAARRGTIGPVAEIPINVLDIPYLTIGR